MKTTLDLPDDLVKEVKLKAVREGRKLKDAIADLLRRGLDAPPEHIHGPEMPILRTEPRTGLPVVICRHPAPFAEQLSPQRVSDILLEQDVTWHHETRR